MTQQPQSPEEIREALKHRDAILDINAILATEAGKRFIKYLFESFEVGVMPERGLAEMDLYDRLGFLRAGNAIFKIVAEASPEIAGMILAKVEKERYDELVMANHSTP